MTPLKFCNRMGFPCIENVGSAVLTTTGETFTFNKHPFVDSYFKGGIFVKVSGTQTAPSTAVPVYFTTQDTTNTTIPLLNAQGTAITTSTWPGDGVYLFFYDRDTDKLQMLN